MVTCCYLCCYLFPSTQQLVGFDTSDTSNILEICLGWCLDRFEPLKMFGFWMMAIEIKFHTSRNLFRWIF